MQGHHHFISYSTVDGLALARQLYDQLLINHIPAWWDKRELLGGRTWDSQLAQAIKDCKTVLFLMTPDSVDDACACYQEYSFALSYKKPVIPLLCARGTRLPFRLQGRQYIDLTGDFESALAQLRRTLERLDSPEGELAALRDRLADANRDLRRASDAADRARIQGDIDLLTKQIADQEFLVQHPEDAANKTEQSIAAALEREREPITRAENPNRARFINAIPVIAPSYFQDRYEETKLIARFLRDDAARILTIVGRAGIGKTAMICRLLRALESGQLPNDLGPLQVDGIVYLTATGTRAISVPNLFADLSKLLPAVQSTEIDSIYKNTQASTETKVQALLGAFPHGRTIVLLDNFETVLDPQTTGMRDTELDEFLRALLNAPQHGVKVIITTRYLARELALVQPGRQTRVHLDEGLESPFAETLLREMDADGKLGLRNAPGELLTHASEYTRGFPRALEALFAILSTDRYTTLQEIIQNPIPPDNVVEALVGEAYSRLDLGWQRVVQALAVYNRPVPVAAIDLLLQPYQPGVSSAPIVNQLVNMQFVRKEMGRFYLHPVDRTYAFRRVPRGDAADRDSPASPYTQFALLARAAGYFRQIRKSHDNLKTLDDLAPQLAEFELLYEAEDYEAAAAVLLEISYKHLDQRGYYRLEAGLHQQLEDKPLAPATRQHNLGRLGSAFYSLGRYPEAVARLNEAIALAREVGDRKFEAWWMGNLGLCYEDLGDNAGAIERHQQALVINASLGDEPGQIRDLSNLGDCYEMLGYYAQAQVCYQLALELDRRSGNPVDIGTELHNLALLLLLTNRVEQATRYAQESTEIAVQENSPFLGCWAFTALARCHLFSGDLGGARTAAETALKYDEPTLVPEMLALYGLIALRQGDRAAAQEKFETAVARANDLLNQAVPPFYALDVKGLALAGLALNCKDVPSRARIAAEATAVYAAARAKNSDAGNIVSELQKLDALALADPQGTEILAGIRHAAAGTK